MAAIAYNLKKLLKYTEKPKSALKQGSLIQNSFTSIIRTIEHLEGGLYKNI